MKRAVIVGSGSEIAPVRLSNAQMARILDTSDEWIRERSGVEQRYFASPEDGHLRPRRGRGRKALEEAGVAKDDVDLVVFATMTPDHYFPGCGALAAGQARPAQRALLRHPPAVRRASSTGCSSRTRRSARAWPRRCCWSAPRSTSASCRGRTANWEYATAHRTCRRRRRSGTGTPASATWWCCSATRARRWCCGRPRTASAASSTTMLHADGRRLREAVRARHRLQAPSLT